MSRARRRFTVLVSVVLVAVALVVGAQAPVAQDPMGAAVREWERRTAQPHAPGPSSARAWSSRSACADAGHDVRLHAGPLAPAAPLSPRCELEERARALRRTGAGALGGAGSGIALRCFLRRRTGRGRTGTRGLPGSSTAPTQRARCASRRSTMRGWRTVR